MDLRKTNRYRVCAPAFFYWENQDRNLQQGKGATRDISISGVFIAAECAPSPGSHVELDVYLPAVSGAARSVQLHGEGQVLRVEGREGAPTGFAAKVVFQTERAGGATVLNSGKPQ